MKFKWFIPLLLLVIFLAGYSANKNGQFRGIGPLSDQFARDISHLSDLSAKLVQFNQQGNVKAAGNVSKINVSSLKMSDKTIKEILDYYYHMPSYKKETKYKKLRPELQLDIQQLTEAEGELSVYLNNSNEPTISAELPSVVDQLNSICSDIQKMDKKIAEETSL